MSATKVQDVSEAILNNIAHANARKLRERIKARVREATAAKCSKPAESGMVEMFLDLWHTRGSK